MPSKDGVKEITANSERVRYWVSVGAQPSDRVAWLFGRIGILPPPPLRSFDPKTFQVPRKVVKKLKEEEITAIAKQYPERIAARAAVKAKVEAKHRRILEKKKAQKRDDRAIN